MARTTTKVILEVEGYITVTDSGYLGTSETVDAHVAKAITDSQRWQFLVKKGAAEPEPVQVKVRVKQVIITPQDE